MFFGCGGSQKRYTQMNGPQDTSLHEPRTYCIGHWYGCRSKSVHCPVYIPSDCCWHVFAFQVFGGLISKAPKTARFFARSSLNFTQRRMRTNRRNRRKRIVRESWATEVTVISDDRITKPKPPEAPRSPPKPPEAPQPVPVFRGLLQLGCPFFRSHGSSH